jgi:hypothetical protein
MSVTNLRETLAYCSNYAADDSLPESICRTVRAKVMKGQVILIISSSVILDYYCLRCGGSTQSRSYIQLFPKACQGHAWACHSIFHVAVM